MSKVRTEAEIEEALNKIGSLLNQEQYEDDEVLQAIYDTLKWVDGHDWDSTIGENLPLPEPEND